MWLLNLFARLAPIIAKLWFYFAARRAGKDAAIRRTLEEENEDIRKAVRARDAARGDSRWARRVRAKFRRRGP